MKKIYLVCIVLQMFLASKTFAQVAQSPLTFKGYNLVVGDHVSILEDTSDRLTFQSALTLPDTRYKLSGTQVPNLQLSKSDFWLKFSIKNESKERHLLL